MNHTITKVMDGTGRIAIPTKYRFALDLDVKRDKVDVALEGDKIILRKHPEDSPPDAD